MENIKENNKLIAEFMCGDMIVENYHGINIIKFPNGSTKDLLGLKYHSSWDWLMPIVEKIEALYNNKENTSYLEQFMDETLYDENYPEWYDEGKFFVLSVIGIEEIYKRVLMFIKWYNKNK